jgi:uncharacterized OsmC-like protein
MSENPRLTARWMGGSSARIEMGDATMNLGGHGELDAMAALLAAMAACDIDVIATHATLLGIKLEQLSVRAEGEFNLAAYLGVEEAPGSGYQKIHLVARLRAPDATPEQIDALRRQLELSSPVGDSIRRAVSMEVKLDVEE